MKASIAIVVLVLPVLILGGCSFGTQPDPDQVLIRFAQQLAQLQSVHYHAKLDLAGGLATNLKNPIDTANLEISGDLVSSLNSPVSYTAEAVIAAKGDKGPIRLAGHVIGLSDYTFFQLQDLALPSLLPISLGDQRWYKVASGQAADTSGYLASGQQDEIRDLLESSQPFTVAESMPTTSINGRRAYHYLLNIDPVGLKDVLTKIYAIVNWDPARLPELDSGQYQTEVFIDTADYQLLRLNLTGTYVHDHLPTQLSLALDLTNHNHPAKIVAPAGVQDIDIKKLLNLP